MILIMRIHKHKRHLESMLIIYRDIPWFSISFQIGFRQTWWCVLFCWRWRLDLMGWNVETLDKIQWPNGFNGSPLKFRSIAPIKCGLSEPKLYLQSNFTSKHFYYYNVIKKIKKHTHNYKWPLFEADSPIFHTKKQQPPPLPHPIRSSPPKPCSGQPWWKSGVNRWCTPRRRRRDHPDPPLQPRECFTAGRTFFHLKKNHMLFFFWKKRKLCDISNLHDIFSGSTCESFQGFCCFRSKQFLSPFAV